MKRPEATWEYVGVPDILPLHGRLRFSVIIYYDSRRSLPTVCRTVRPERSAFVVETNCQRSGSRVEVYYASSK